MFADPKKVAGRRLRRRLKAGASIALALVAGAFLACKGGNQPQEASPTGPDARGPQPPNAHDVDGASGADGVPAAAGDGGADASTDAGTDASTALVVVDGGKDAGPHARAPKVDKREHRKGMPVRDNLLE